MISLQGRSRLRGGGAVALSGRVTASAAGRAAGEAAEAGEVAKGTTAAIGIVVGGAARSLTYRRVGRRDLNLLTNS